MISNTDLLPLPLLTAIIVCNLHCCFRRINNNPIYRNGFYRVWHEHQSGSKVFCFFKCGIVCDRNVEALSWRLIGEGIQSH